MCVVAYVQSYILNVIYSCREIEEVVVAVLVGTREVFFLCVGKSKRKEN